jgi:predicted metal-dependent hydrolase
LTEQNWHQHSEYLWGVDLYNSGFTWEAHEVWESLWRGAADASSMRSFLQGLIQCAAASVKSALADGVASARVAQRAIGRLRAVQQEQGAMYMGVDLAELVAALETFVVKQPVVFDGRPLMRLTLPRSHCSTPSPGSGR